jgi:type II secretory pathway pseudopilin PulG
VIALAAVTALSLIWAVAAQVRARHERATASALQQALRQATLRPASTERPSSTTSSTGSSATPDAQIHLPEPPELLELYLPVGYTQYSTFAVTVDKVDHGRLLVLQRLVADSNRDLRVGLNSSAFGAGEYRIRLTAGHPGAR